jgi:hypothetical protein
MALPPSFFLWVEMLIAEIPFPVKGKKTNGSIAKYLSI